MARQERNRRLVEPSSSVDVDGVGDIFSRLLLVDGWMKGFVLASRSEEEATVWGER